MKKLILSVCALVLLSLLQISCKKDDFQPNQKEGTVEFGFALKAPSNSGAQKTSMKAPAAEPAAVVVSIKKANGNSAYTMQRVELYNMNGYYISKPLSLLPGSYTVEQFFVVDAAGSVMYASPVQGSPKAYLVSKPLPIGFTVGKDVVTKVVPEVLSAAGSTPEDFGYTTFSFDVVNTFDFLIGVFVYNESVQNFELTNAHLNIVVASKTIFTDTLGAITNKVTVNDGYDNYIISVSKIGYSTFTDTISNTELKKYFLSTEYGPLKVYLLAQSNTNPCAGINSLVYGGQTYHTVAIGTQCWMKENLNIGTQIYAIQDRSNNGIIEKYCYLDSASNCNKYGGLYSWHEAMNYSVNEGSTGICPNGWHIPTQAEVTSLYTFLGGRNIAGGKMKEMGTAHWNIPNTGATNSSGFTSLGGGWHNSGPHTPYSFGAIGEVAYYWTSTGHANPQPDVMDEDYASIAFTNYYALSSASLNTNMAAFANKFSIRCIKNY